MLAEELVRAKTRATIQAEQRNARHAARCLAQLTLTHTTSDLSSNIFHSINIMEDQQYRKIIDIIPIFSGEPRDNIIDWIEIVTLKFDIIGYDSHQRRHFLSQYLAGNALKWHLSRRE